MREERGYVRFHHARRLFRWDTPFRDAGPNGDWMGTATAATETKHDPSGKAWRRKAFAVAVAAVLVISAVGYAASKGLIWPHRTDGIDDPFSEGGATFGFKAAPGDERIFLDFFQHKPVDDVITIEQITAGTAKGPVRVLEVAIAIRRPGEPFLVPIFMYPVDPTTAWRECDAQFITDPTGYEVQPGEVVMLVQKLRFTESGAGELASAEIIFRWNGVRFRSHPGMHLEFEVDERFDKTILKPSWERACGNPDGVF